MLPDRKGRGSGAEGDGGLRESLLGGHGDGEEPDLSGPGTLVDPGKREGPLLALMQAIVDSWNCVVAALLGSLSLIFPDRPPQLTEVQGRRLRSLWERIRIPYDASEPEHQEALERLWRASFPGMQYHGPRSPQWKEMGWQGEDPGTDFRGGGYLALQNLLYLAEDSKETFKQLMTKAVGQRSDWEYPFAVAGVNITFTLTETLDLRNNPQPPSSSPGKGFLGLLGTSEAAFEEVYVVTFELLDETWLEMKASYMEFPTVMARVRKQLEEALSKCPTDVPELRQLLSL